MSRGKKLEDSRKILLDGIGVPEAGKFVPDPFQLEAIESLKRGLDTLVIAPTGSGKTYIAREAIEKVVEGGKRAVYTAPLKALSNSKYAEMRDKFEPRYKVGLLTGDRKIEADADIVIATTEIYRNDLYSMRGNYSLVVLDEVHYLADPQRGPVWEESIILSPSDATLLMLSASISNPEEIADWISSVRKKEVNVIQVSDRPVELRLAFFHPQEGILPLADSNGEVISEINDYYRNGSSGRRRATHSRGDDSSRRRSSTGRSTKAPKGKHSSSRSRRKSGR